MRAAPAILIALAAAALALGGCNARGEVEAGARQADAHAARADAHAERAAELARGIADKATDTESDRRTEIAADAGEARRELDAARAEIGSVRELLATAILGNLHRLENATPLVDFLGGVLRWGGLAALVAGLWYVGALPLVAQLVRSGLGLTLGRLVKPRKTAAAELLAEALEAGDLGRVRESAAAMRADSPIVDGAFRQRSRQRKKAAAIATPTTPTPHRKPTA